MALNISKMTANRYLLVFTPYLKLDLGKGDNSGIQIEI